VSQPPCTFPGEYVVPQCVTERRHPQRPRERCTFEQGHAGRCSWQRETEQQRYLAHVTPFRERLHAWWTGLFA
jgi:hypothetical protein